MLFGFGFCSGVLLATRVVLAHHPFRHGARMASRRDEHQLRLNHRQGDGMVNDIWAGCIVEPGDGTFSSITGTFTAVTKISGRPGSAATVWIGIDSPAFDEQGLFQAGVDLVVAADGSHKYNAWVEWYPAGAIFFPDIKITGGDRIKVALNVTSSTLGIVTIWNLSNGQNTTQTVTNLSAPISADRAEWIVEDFMDFPGADTYFADFGTVAFMDAMAIVDRNRSMTPADASICNIGKNGTVLTSVSVDGSSVAITHL